MNIPAHIAIIPDGNRRWARKNNLPEFEGHRISAEKVLPDIIDCFMNAGVKYFTFWALSPENFVKRSPQEVNNLINLMKFFLKKKTGELHKKNIRIQIIGDMSVFKQDVQDLISSTIETTKNNTAMTVVFAINYGGRNEMVRAVNKIIESGEKNVTPETISSHLDTHNMPDPDLTIRTGGEKRLSGFMLWQSEYTEYEFSDKLFPEFTVADCNTSIEKYSQRERRFGK